MDISKQKQKLIELKLEITSLIIKVIQYQSFLQNSLLFLLLFTTYLVAVRGMSEHLILQILILFASYYTSRYTLSLYHYTYLPVQLLSSILLFIVLYSSRFLSLHSSHLLC